MVYKPAPDIKLTLSWWNNNVTLSLWTVTGDFVYLASEAERQEYVLSQDGLIYYGKVKHIKVLPWTFGQVLRSVLNCSLPIVPIVLDFPSNTAIIRQIRLM